MLLRDIINRKDQRLVTVQVGTKVIDAVKLMVENKIGAILILDGDQVRGIFTERDHLKATATGRADPGNAIIDDYMTTDLVVGVPSDTIEAAMAMMTEKRVRHLPVMNDSELGGIVSIGDVVKAVAEQQEIELRYLKDYVTGNIS